MKATDTSVAPSRPSVAHEPTFNGTHREFFQHKTTRTKPISPELTTTISSHQTTSSPHITKRPNSKKKHSHKSIRLVYIKTRKTGSSTITNILYRFALRHNLTVMTFVHNHPKTGKQFPVHQLPFLRGERQPKYNLIMEHLYYRREFFDEILPGNKTFISSLRHPLDQLKSDIHFEKSHEFGRFSVKKKLDRFSKSRDFMQNYDRSFERLARFRSGSSKLTKDTLDKVLMFPRKLNRYGQRYLTLPEPSFRNGTASYEINSLVRKLADEFSFMLITEYFDESLVLLKRILSWDLRDIVYSPLKRGKYPKKGKDHSPEHLTRHQELKPEEYALYDHFNTTFWQLVNRESVDFWDEVRHYKQTNGRILRFCEKYHKSLQKDSARVSEIVQNNETLVIDQSKWSEAFTIDVLDCVLMKIDKDIFLIMNSVRNFPQLCNTQIRRRFPFMQREKLGIRAFRIRKKVPVFNPQYCSHYTTRYQLPLNVLKFKGAFDWDDYFKKMKSP